MITKESFDKALAIVSEYKKQIEQEVAAIIEATQFIDQKEQHLFWQKLEPGQQITFDRFGYKARKWPVRGTVFWVLQIDRLSIQDGSYFEYKLQLKAENGKIITTNATYFPPLDTQSLRMDEINDKFNADFYFITTPNSPIK
jgi:hypothetical protein